MTDYARPYDGRDDGANPSPGEFSWSDPFDDVLEFHKYDADGADTSGIFGALLAGDQIGLGADGSVFVVVATTSVQNRWRVTVEQAYHPVSTDRQMVVFRVGQDVPPGPDPEPVAHPRPWNVTVAIR